MHGFGEVGERLRRSTVRILGEGGGVGSGIIWTGGRILTNAHVARSKQTEVELWDGRRLPARLTSRDARRDLALLRAEAGSIEPARAGDSAALRPGELVIAVGSPMGFAGALSTGVVHSAGPRWILADVRLAPGNSGGPLANARGEVIGINTAIVNGLGAAVPSRTAIDFIERGPRPALGVTLRPSPPGLQILEVDPQGAAAAASLRAGDVLLGSFDDLHAALDSGSEVLRLQFLRGGNRIREVYVRLPGRVSEAA